MNLVREQLDLSEILTPYGEERGYPPYHPGDDDDASALQLLPG